jgi:hypothetical protein
MHVSDLVTKFGQATSATEKLGTGISLRYRSAANTTHISAECFTLTKLSVS